VLASLLPSASLVELPGIAHMFWVEAPDAAEAAVRRALC
jgi:pimeloyl-ACP methyl ester carboxylesterase